MQEKWWYAHHGNVGRDRGHAWGYAWGYRGHVGGRWRTSTKASPGYLDVSLLAVIGTIIKSLKFGDIAKNHDDRRSRSYRHRRLEGYRRLQSSENPRIPRKPIDQAVVQGPSS